MTEFKVSLAEKPDGMMLGVPPGLFWFADEPAGGKVVRVFLIGYHGECWEQPWLVPMVQAKFENDKSGGKPMR